jgi:GT2 family glycosyltransferase
VEMIPNLTVPVLNRYDLLQRMLDSLDYPIGHLLIIDNGAADVEQAFELNVPVVVEHTTYLPMPANLGVAASWNLGIKSFPYDDVWFFASNDMAFSPGDLERLSGARRDEITLASMFPYWQAFAVGYEAVSALGLFSEAFFPAYFEDNDYMRRAEHHGVPVRRIEMDLWHENSATINSDDRLRQRNNETFSRNRARFEWKMSGLDFGHAPWDVEVRRLNGWEADR